MRKTLFAILVAVGLGAHNLPAQAGGYHGGCGWHGGGWGCGYGHGWCGWWPAFGIGLGLGVAASIPAYAGCYSAPAPVYSYPTVAYTYSQPAYVYHSAPASAPTPAATSHSNTQPPQPAVSQPSYVPSTASATLASAPPSVSPAVSLPSHGTWIQDPTPYRYIPEGSPTVAAHKEVAAPAVTVSQAGSIPVYAVAR
jgi:hypothetical protein